MIKRAVSVISVFFILFLPMDSFAAEGLAKKVMVDALYGAGIGVTVGFANGFARAAVPGGSYNPRRQAGDMLAGLVIGAAIGAAYGLVTGRGGAPEAPREKTAEYDTPGMKDGRFYAEGPSVPWFVKEANIRDFIKEAGETKIDIFYDRY